MKQPTQGTTVVPHASPASDAFGLYPHQREGVAFLRRKGHAILGDDMGLGKTRQAIVAMKLAAPEGCVLVVCPASLKLNWAREIRAVEPDAAIEVLGVAGHACDNPRWVIVNYDLLGKHEARLQRVPWSGVVLDEAHFIKNASGRSARCLRLLGVDGREDRAFRPLQVYLLTGTPLTNRPRDLFNLLRAVGHPAARSFLSFAKRYCGAYRNDYGWVTDGASNLDELNLLMKEVMLRRRKEEVLDLPPKIRSWIPVAIDGAPVRAHASFLKGFAGSDPAKPNDRNFLARLTAVRTALHRAKHAAVAERIRDVLATGQKVVVFCCFQQGIDRHRKALGEAAVTITGADNAESRQAAVERFQTDPAVRVALCNLVAGGVGITLTAASHVIFQDLDWVPANHRQAEDRAYRLGQKEAVTVEYFFADGTLDGYIASLMETKLALADAVEAELVPEANLLHALQANLTALAPALLQESRLLAADGDAVARLDALSARLGPALEASPVADTGQWEFPSSRDPSKRYRVTFGRAGHLECSCEGFRWRGECSHVRQVRAEVAA
ncbi:MAG: DEAD/DEAH box helicase [Rhodocyclaceae bacterium]|nr:DEAD/DEAH box helicase [Rhodocyclaceae bacterium]